MGLDIVKPEPPRQYKGSEEILGDRIKAKHKENIAWLESNNFEEGYIGEKSKNMIFKALSIHGKLVIRLYLSGETGGYLNVQNVFSAEKEIEKFKKDLESKCSTLVADFTKGISDLEAKAEEKNEDLQERMEKVLPAGVDIEHPFSAEVQDYSGNLVSRYIENTNIELKIDYSIVIEECKKTAQEIYETLAKAVEALEGEF